MRSKAASGTERERESDAPHRRADILDQKGRARTAPSLAELRRRARHRLRELSCALTRLQEEHATAAAECTRLRAGNNLPEVRVAAPPDTDDDPTPSAPQAGTAQRAAERVQALQEELTTSRDSLAAEQARTRKFQESAEALAGRLREAEAMLSDEQERHSALRARARELEAQLADVRAHSVAADSPEELQARVVGLQVDLARTLEANGRLREEMDGLLRFLDELSEVLPPPGAAQSPVRQSERA